MFCKNARSKLAMAAVSEVAPKAAPVVTPQPVVAQQQQQPQQPQQPQQRQPQVTPTSAFLAALRQKVPEQLLNNNNCNSNNQMKAFPSYGSSTLQLLQRQMEMMQQEQQNKHFELLQQERAKRMLLEQAAYQNLLPNNASIPKQVSHTPIQQSNTHASRLMQMQQLMQLQQHKRQVRTSTNPRASAA
jgi:hypothetical protein